MIYYVRPDGNNTNNGLGPDITGINKAFATISKAASVLVAGDTVYIAPGTYRESVTPTNNGSPGLPITYKGDRKCEFFPGLTIGDVILSGLDAETSISRTRSTLFGGTKSYINISNLDFENSSCGILMGSNCNIENCNLTKGMLGYTNGAIQVGSTSTITNCKSFTTTSRNLYMSGSGYNINNCILKSSAADIIYLAAAATGAYLNHCIIDGGYNPTVTPTTLFVNGCVWRIPSTSNNGILLSDATQLIQARGSLFIGKGGISMYSSSSFLGCKFLGCATGLYNPGGTPTIQFCEFETCETGISLGNGGGTILSNYFKCNSNAMQSTQAYTVTSCRFYSNGGISATGVLTNTTPYYGEAEVMAGIKISSSNPISGAKSLMIMGFDYGAVFTQMVPCEAGKPKTVKLKIKRNSATDGTTVRLGDQLVQMSNKIKRVGNGWLLQTSGSVSGGFAFVTPNKDDYVEYAFNGTGIRLISSKQTSYGNAGISIDGGSETIVDLYSASPLNIQTVFDVSGLSNGGHKIKVRNLGTKNASSTGYTIHVDAFDVFNSSWLRTEAETILTTVETIDVTYTHHKTELVPLFINTRVASVAADFVQYDDITT